MKAITTAAAALALLVPASPAFADGEVPVPDGWNGGQTYATCDYEATWTAEICGSFGWTYPKGGEPEIVLPPPVKVDQAEPPAPAPAAAPAARPARATRIATPAPRRFVEVVVPSRPFLAGGDRVVEAGDCLWTIAADELGSGFRWQEIAAANGLPTVGSPTIYAGETLALP